MALVTGRNMKYAILFFFILPIVSCNTIKHSYVSPEEENWVSSSLPDDEIMHSIYLFGEMGRIPVANNPITQHIQRTLQQAESNTTAIFLGSHLYPKGLSGKKKSRRAAGEAELRSKLSLLDGFPGNYYFVGGEHDWEYRGDLGHKAINRMEDFFEDELEQKDPFLPEKGCGDPTNIKVEDDVVLIFINSQWWLEDWPNEPGINKGCDVKSKSEFIDEFKEVVLKNKNKHLFVVMHHPLLSNGVKGGKIPFKYHMFPLTEIKPKAWVPLPILGSAAAAHRKINGYRQDLSQADWQRMKQEVTDLLFLSKLKNITFIAAHEYAMQYFEHLDNHFITSGTSGGDGYARAGGDAGFASARQGFGKITIYANDEEWLEFYGLQDDKLEVVYRKQLVSGKADEKDVLAQFDFNPIPDSITHIAGPAYAVTKFRKFWFGNTYRDEWTTPVTLRTLDVSTERGGLTPLKKGGGTQTNSLRSEVDSTGHQVVFRSIYKDAYTTTPDFVRGTWGQDVMQDMMSAAHPYNALVIPTLSKAANIYHTEPEIVYIPKQPGLGIYNETFGEEFYIYEDRPTGDRRDFDGFGNSEKIIGINDLLPKLEDKHDHVVDQPWVLRSRLFDMWIHDWDRHDDQWRWASFKEGDRTIYRPIPRDRDQTFFTFDGALPWLVATLGVKNLRTFKHELKKPQHQSVNAAHFDRYFLNQMDLGDWMKQAKYLKENLTDAAIDEAFEAWPDTIFALGADEIKEKLRSRREYLPKMAETMYRFLARNVDVTGTEKADKFKVERHRDGSVTVRVYDLDSKGKKKDKYYERAFYRKETREIRLYGMGGDDEFELDGKSKRGIKIRIIGGTGDDELDDDSRIRGGRKMTKVYDEREGIDMNNGKEIHDMTSNRYNINDYNREYFLYNKSMPLLDFGSNIDDGFFIGGGITLTNQGFRKTPYKSMHSINGLVAPRTNAFEFHYHVHRVGTFHRLNADLYFESNLYRPFYINYYGRGNETPFDQSLPDEFYWVRLEDYKVATGIRKDWLQNRYSFRIGPEFRSTQVVVIDGRISEAPAGGLDDSDKARKNFMGFSAKAAVNAVQMDGVRQVDGLSFSIGAAYYNQLRNADQFGGLEGEMAYYLTFFKKLPTTIATRIGAMATFGDVPFYHSNHIGGDNYLRGFRRNRYTGKYLFYQNIDLRVRLVDWNNKVLPMEIGLLGGFDYGRVWEPGEDSDRLHKGYTAGIWISPFSVANLTFNYSFGEEENLFSFGFGFFF